MSWMNQQYQGGYGQPQGYMQPQPTGYMPQMQQPMPMQASRARHLARPARPAALTTHAMLPQAQRTGFQPQMPIQVRLLSPAAVRARRGRGDPRPSAPTTPARPRPLTARPHALLMLRSRKLPASWACDSSLR